MVAQPGDALDRHFMVRASAMLSNLAFLIYDVADAAWMIDNGLDV